MTRDTCTLTHTHHTHTHTCSEQGRGCHQTFTGMLCFHLLSLEDISMKPLTDSWIIQHAKTRCLAVFPWLSFIALYWIQWMDEFIHVYLVVSRMDELINDGRVSEWTNKCMKMSKWVNWHMWWIVKCTNRQVNEQINYWITSPISQQFVQILRGV